MALSIGVSELIFNEQNIEHIARHQVTPKEVAQVIEGKTLYFKAKLGRIMALGKTDTGRTLVVILERVGTRRFFVVTARAADRKERSMHHEKTNQNS